MDQNHSIIFREAEVADIPQMQVVRNAVKENMLSHPSVVKDEDYGPFLTAMGKGCVCLVDEQLVGFSIVDVDANSVWALFVLPEFERMGIGKKLMNMLLNWYFSVTTSAIWLSTEPGTRAEQFYRKYGWQETGTYGKGEVKFELTYDKWERLRFS